MVGAEQPTQVLPKDALELRCAGPGASGNHRVDRCTCPPDPREEGYLPGLKVARNQVNAPVSRQTPLCPGLGLSEMLENQFLHYTEDIMGTDRKLRKQELP